MLSNSPGSVGFELAPFKLPQEYLDVLGGVGSEKFAEFKALMKVAFLALQKKCENIVGLVQLMELGLKMGISSFLFLFFLIYFYCIFY